MFPLSIKDIREWMIENRAEYKRLDKEEFSTLSNALRWLYIEFKDLLECYSCAPDCDAAMRDIKSIIESDPDGLIEWAKKYEYLGAKKLLLFEILYMNWEDELNNDHLKVQKDIYIEKAPFINVICFCNIFTLLYWESEIHLAEKGAVDDFLVSKVKRILRGAGILN